MADGSTASKDSAHCRALDELVLADERQRELVPCLAVVRPPIGERESRLGFGSAQVGGRASLAGALQVKTREVQVIQRAGRVASGVPLVEGDVGIPKGAFGNDVVTGPGRPFRRRTRRGDGTRNDRECRRHENNGV